MKEAGRRCQRCEFAWYATPPGASPGKPRWFDESGSFWTDGQARMGRRTSNYERHLTAKDRWQQCPNCGSRSVKTDQSREFRPTGAIAPPQASGPLPSSGARPPVTTPNGPTIWERIAKLHAEHWRIIWAVVFALAPFGSVGDDGVRTGSAILTVLAIIAIFIGCWIVAGFFLHLHLEHRKRESPSE